MKQTNSSLENKSMTITACLCMAVFLLGMVFFFFGPKRDYSENENRYLAKAPKLSGQNLLDGSFMQDAEDYVIDQFPLRDGFVGLNSLFQKIEGKKQIGQIYLCKDGYLIGEYRPMENIDRIQKTFHDFGEKMESILGEGKTFLMLVPSAATLYADKLPAGAPMGNQLEDIEVIRNYADLPFADAYPYLLKAREEGNLFYRTDHHWTSEGAYQGYLAFCEVAGLEAIPIDGFDKEKVTDGFYGTYSSKVNLPFMKGDTITLYRNPEDKLTVTYEDTGEVSDSLYNLDYLTKKDKYSLFLNNIHPLITIENASAMSQRVLVLVKDSYANSMVPFLTGHFKTIYVFDPRYVKTSISSFVADHEEVTDVLLLYNLSTLDGDTGVRAIY